MMNALVGVIVHVAHHQFGIIQAIALNWANEPKTDAASGVVLEIGPLARWAGRLLTAMPSSKRVLPFGTGAMVQKGLIFWNCFRRADMVFNAGFDNRINEFRQRSHCHGHAEWQCTCLFLGNQRPSRPPRVSILTTTTIIIVIINGKAELGRLTATRLTLCVAKITIGASAWILSQ